jgi:hypothetical protein
MIRNINMSSYLMIEDPPKYMYKRFLFPKDKITIIESTNEVYKYIENLDKLFFDTY